MIRENIHKVRERIARACGRVKRDPSEVTLVTVTKGRTIDEIRLALNAGMTDLGENRIQEAGEKFRLLVTGDRRPVTTHMIGHLQTNKVKDAVHMFDLIQSVDSLHLAREIDRQAARIGKAQDVLIEIKTSPEATKYGMLPGEAKGAVEEISALKNIRICGLMTIAPVADNPEQARPYFGQLKELSDALNRQTGGQVDRPTILSMGMTDDFEIAVEEGATMVRLGRAIFG